MNINAPTCAAGEAAQVLEEMFSLNQALMIWGPPGVGKSSLVEAAARKLGAGFIDVRLATKTAADIGGLPALDHATGRTRFYLPEFLPREAGPGILFFDELPGADEQTRIAVYGLMLERRMGEYRIPDGWMVVAAGNRECDGAYSVGLGTAMNNRLVHLVIEPDIGDWTRWALGQDLDSRIIAFLNRNPHRLHNAAEAIRSRRAIFPTPRGWERVSTQIRRIRNRKALRLAVAGTVGDETASEFFAVFDEIASLASVDQILEASDKRLNELFPKTITGLYSLGYALAARIPESGKGDDSEAGRAREAGIRKDISRMWNVVSFLKRWFPAVDGLAVEEVRTFIAVLLSDRMRETNRMIGNEPGFDEWNEDMNRRMRASA